MNANIVVYGVDDCEDTKRARAFLDNRGITYRYVNIDQDKAGEEMVKRENDGKRRTPLIEVKMGLEVRVLRVPTNEELENAIRDLQALDAA